MWQEYWGMRNIHCCLALFLYIWVVFIIGSILEDNNGFSPEPRPKTHGHVNMNYDNAVQWTRILFPLWLMEFTDCFENFQAKNLGPKRGRRNRKVFTHFSRIFIIMIICTGTVAMVTAAIRRAMQDSRPQEWGHSIAGGKCNIKNSVNSSLFPLQLWQVLAHPKCRSYYPDSRHFRSAFSSVQELKLLAFSLFLFGKTKININVPSPLQYGPKLIKAWGLGIVHRTQGNECRLFSVVRRVVLLVCLFNEQQTIVQCIPFIFVIA